MFSLKGSIKVSDIHLNIVIKHLWKINKLMKIDYFGTKAQHFQSDLFKSII